MARNGFQISKSWKAMHWIVLNSSQLWQLWSVKIAMVLAKSELPTLWHCGYVPAVDEDVEPLYLFQELEPDLKQAGIRAPMGTRQGELAVFFAILLKRLGRLQRRWKDIFAPLWIPILLYCAVSSIQKPEEIARHLTQPATVAVGVLGRPSTPVSIHRRFSRTSAIRSKP